MATVRKLRIVQTEGNHEVKHYSLQTIIAIGFKTNNAQASPCKSN